MSTLPTTLLLAAAALSCAIAIKSATAAHDGPRPPGRSRPQRPALRRLIAT